MSVGTLEVHAFTHTAIREIPDALLMQACIRRRHFLHSLVLHPPLLMRCVRVTSSNLTLKVGMNFTGYRCLEVSNFDARDDEPLWTQRSSPWSTPRDCWWPLDTEDERLCAFDSSPGKHKCDHDARYMEQEDFRWCGSEFDALGNRRFRGGLIEGVEWQAGELAVNATFVESLNWGYTTFDNIFDALLSIFQSITLEGWSEIMYQVRRLLVLRSEYFFFLHSFV